MSLPFAPTTRRALVALSLGLVGFTACGSGDDSSDGNGEATVEEFCTRLDEVASQDNVDADALAALDQLAASAPSDIAEDMADFAAVFAVLVAASADTSPDADPAILEDGLTEYNSLAARLDTWTNDNCPDLPENLFSVGG